MANFVSFQNIRLAWIRTLSGENPYYRNLQRIEIDSFGWAEEDNLLQIQRELKEGTFNPSSTTRVYIPKASGMLRPITVLRVRDSIVYQAIANVIAEKARRRLYPYYLKSAFSNILTSPNYDYFYRRWKYGYYRLDLARKQAFRDGYVWLGELDLASFYDVIDHNLLRAMLEECYTDDEVLQLLFSCLSEWTSRPGGHKHIHGIPQGPLPSSFMAECALHSLDRRMSSIKNSVYLRYVDDITVLSVNEKEARRQFARIEIICRDLGLVPQVRRSIQKLDDVEDLFFGEPSPIGSTADFPPSVSRKESDEARRIFLSCFRAGKLNLDKPQLGAKLNYSLSRMNPDKRILNKVWSLLSTMPSLFNALNYYLRRFGRDSSICGRLLDYLETEPIYDVVSASCLETAYNSCTRGQYTRLWKRCKKYLSTRCHTVLRSTAARILGLRKASIHHLKRLTTTSDDTYLMEHLLLALCSALSDADKEQLLNRCIRSQDPDVALTSAYLLTSNNLKLVGSLKDLNPWATPILVNKGFTKKRVMGDRIGEIINKRYSVTLPTSFSFRKVLNKRQYKQALLHLQNAEGGFATNRSFWVTQMDNFNQILLFIVYKKLGMSVSYDNVFGSITSRKLVRQFPNMAGFFQQCHELRSSSFVAHAYSRLLGTFSRDVKPKERDKLCKGLGIAYQEFVNKS